jgi:hypothetical protein
VSGSLKAVAWIDLDGVMVLRMDDPGGAENVHHRVYSHTKLGAADWSAIGNALEQRQARLSIGYVSGWVDDASTARGNLTIAGRVPHRMPGTVYPSPLVRYEDVNGRVHDYSGEFNGIEGLRRAGLADVELHGYTHMHPDTSAWAKAADRYESAQWYRELGEAARQAIASRPAWQHPLALGMAAFRHFFKMHPTTLICPGEQWTNDSLKCALQLGLQLVGSYYLALRDGGRFCWSQHVCAPYLDQADSEWFEAGLPVVGYFHDFDVCRRGVEWFSDNLERWRSAGAKRFIDYRELAAGLSCRLSLEERDNRLHLTVTNGGGPALVRDLKIAFRVPHGPVPSRISAHFDGREISLPVDAIDKEAGTVALPGIRSTWAPTSGELWRA